MSEIAHREILPDGTFVLDTATPLPPVLDVLIVGGGPFGTAVAFRAKELGLTALVVDHDDLMARIRDQARGTMIVPDFRGGDRMRFPEGGPLIRSLQFEAMDKDALCAAWKRAYRQHSVPAKIGVEMTGLSSEAAGWSVSCWNWNTRSDQRFRAHHVVVATGRGGPRQLELSGDTDDLVFKINDVSAFLGDQPACVIGDGPSAAEAVIAISNAKRQAGEREPVYWSYRGDRMPKVPRELADTLLHALITNGNIRHMPASEPDAVVGTGDAARLAIRTSRLSAAGEPVQTIHLEFLKRLCVACVGEDVPESLLKSIGCPPVTGGPNNQRRLAVSPLLESRQPNLYFAGDLLSPTYLETTNFQADAGGYSEVVRRGNIKSALRDGVFVAEVIAQKRAGRKVITVALEFAPDAQTVLIPPAERVLARSEAPEAAKERSYLLVNVLPGGVEGSEFAIKPTGDTTIGRSGADISFPEDTSLAPHHVVVSSGSGGCRVRAAAGAVGVYLQPTPETVMVLDYGMMLRAGRQWFQAGNESQPTSLLHFDPDGGATNRFELATGVTIVGRESPDISVAPSDDALSRMHFAIVCRNRRLGLKDLGGGDGTFVQVDRSIAIGHGDCIVAGRQRLRFCDDVYLTRPAGSIRLDTSTVVLPARPDKAATATIQPTAAIPSPARAPMPVMPAAPAVEPVALPTEPTVTFQPGGQPQECPQGQTILQTDQFGDERLSWKCEQGWCGLDPIKIVSGSEHLCPMTSREAATLKDTCRLGPGPYRLACMSRITGPVVVEVVELKK